MSYVVSGAIYDGDALIFRTTSAYPVLTRGSGNKSEIIMERMSASLSKGRGGPISGVPWAVTEIAGEAIAEDDPPMLTLDGEGRFGFYGGCNRFSGQAEIGEDGTFSMPENFAGTLMACPPEREQLERAVLEAFRTVTAYHREGSGLALQDEAGTTVMRFEERPD